MSKTVIAASQFERARLIQRARDNLAEIRQLFLDADHWNSIHPNEPIDPDPDGELRKIAVALQNMLNHETARQADKGRAK